MTADEPLHPPAERPAVPAAPLGHTESSSRARLVVMVLAVGLAAVGLVSLVMILGIAYFQGTVWPGLVLATYLCLPAAFLLMMSLVVWSVRSRRRP